MPRVEEGHHTVTYLYGHLWNQRCVWLSLEDRLDTIRLRTDGIHQPDLYPAPLLLSLIDCIYLIDYIGRLLFLSLLRGRERSGKQNCPRTMCRLEIFFHRERHWSCRFQ